MARRLAQRRIAVAVLIAMVVGALAGLAVATNGEPASAVRLLTGDAWLENSSPGSVSHVNGYSGGTDAQAAVGKAGDPFEVVQRAGGAYVLDLRTGRLSRIDDSTMDVTTAATEKQPAAGLQIITGGNSTWILDRSSGILQQVNPTTLAPVGRQIALGGPTGAGVVDQTGSVWVPVGTAAVVDQVDPGGIVTRHPFGHPHDDVQLADTASGVWAVDPQTATAASVSVGGVHPVALPALSAAPLLGFSQSSPNLVLVSGPQVLDIDTSHPSLSSVALPAAAQTTQVAVVSGRAYLLDSQAHQLQTINLSPMGVLPPIPVPPGSDQLVTKDQLVFVNSTSTPQALVVGPKGSVTDVSKYSPPAPTRPGRGAGLPSPGAAGVPSPAATLVPSFSNSPGPGPAGPSTSGPPAAGPGNPPAPPPTRPPAAPRPSSAPPPSQLTVPGAPTVQATGNSGQISVNWYAPASNGGSPVVKYQVTGSPVNPSQIVPATTIRTTVGVPNGTRECVQVQAFNRVGGGAFGQACATAQANSPGQVTGLTARASGPGQIALSWNAPSLGPYSTPIQYYTVSGGPKPVTARTNSTTVSGLANGHKYSFTVTATNDANSTGPPSASVSATTWSTPSAVTNLSVTAGDHELTVKWGPASVKSGSPNKLTYEVSVGGGKPAQLSSPATVPATPWTNETVNVYAVNAAGNGPTSSATGTAWARSATHLCFDSLNGDRAIEDFCSNVVPGGAWTDEGTNTGITWIDYPDRNGGHPSNTNEYLCTTYYVSAPGLNGTTVSGDVYALVTSPSQSACTSKLPGYQKSPPDIPHPIASVSSTALPNSSQHICEYEGISTGTSGKFTVFELSPCGRPPTNLTSASQKFDFYT